MTPKIKHNCRICKDEGWVCEDHPKKAWGEGDGCCGAAGMPCKCNVSDPPWHHGVTAIETVANDQLIFKKKAVFRVSRKK